MCGRFNIIDDPLTKLIVEIANQSFDIQTSYNLAPTDQIPVLRYEEGRWDLPMMRWWLVPFWAKEPSVKYSMFNAKSETLEKSSAFKKPFERRRCVIPASGYYEWKKEGGVKVPYYIQPENNHGFAFAGLWDRWRGDDQVIESCTIITAAAPDAMQSLHNRIPVHLTTAEVQRWVNADTGSDELKQLLAPKMKGPVLVTPMSTYVSNSRHKDERCVEPLGETSVIH